LAAFVLLRLLPLEFHFNFELVIFLHNKLLHSFDQFLNHQFSPGAVRAVLVLRFTHVLSLIFCLHSINVQTAPVFVNKLESRDVFESTPVKLECDVEGFPLPEITWYKDGAAISRADSHRKLTYEDGSCSLYIDRVRTEDEAEYVCEAKNEHGSDSTWAELMVEKLIEGMEQLVREEYHELEVEMEFKWKKPKKTDSAPTATTE